MTHTHHDLLLAVDRRQIAWEGEESLAHVSCVVQVSECLEQRGNTQELAVGRGKSELFLS